MTEICPLHHKQDGCTIHVEDTQISIADFSALPVSSGVERSRLEREVLKAVKVAWIDGLISSTSLNDAVKALVEFEAKQETK